MAHFNKCQDAAKNRFLLYWNDFIFELAFAVLL